MSIKWTLQKFNIKDLKDYYKNPRTLTDEQFIQLKISLEKFGLIDKPIVTQAGLIIGGHQRKRVLEKLGVKEIECYVPDKEMTEKEIEELNIRLNKNTGEWDFEILANQWNTKDLLDWGFKEEDFNMGPVEDIEEDESEILQPPAEADIITKLGDIYTLGDHILVCGDSTDPEDVKRCLGENEPILMVTDPPYGVAYDASWRGGISGKGKRAAGKVQNDNQINWSLAWHLFPGSIAYVWHAGKFASEVQKSLEKVEYEIISQIIWVKQHFALSRGDYHWQHEPCWYAVKKEHNHNWQGARDQTTTWEISNLNAFGKNQEDDRTCHSTQKPLECMARPIKNNTCIGDQVYDPFLGSGTTLIACEQLNRKCFGIELDPAYCDVVIKRWIKYRQKQGKTYSIIRNGIEEKSLFL
jgi:DNA modification methylase